RPASSQRPAPIPAQPHSRRPLAPTAAARRPPSGPDRCSVAPGPRCPQAGPSNVLRRSRIPMHKLLRTSVALALAAPLGAMADTPSEIRALRQELEAMRSTYEARLQAMEQRLKAAE